jgi:hypothetical protein
VNGSTVADDFGAAFRSVHPDVLATWEVNRKAMTTWERRNRLLRNKYLGGAALVQDFHTAHHHVMGIAVPCTVLDAEHAPSQLQPGRHVGEVNGGWTNPANYEPPAGWRVLKRNEYIGPSTVGTASRLYAEPIPESSKNGRSPEAKLARELMVKFQPPPNIFKRFITLYAMPGLIMAADISGRMALHYPAIGPDERDQSILIYWSCDPKMVGWTGTMADGTIYFEPIKISEYYALQGK